MYVGSDSLQSLVMARRLLLLNRQIEKQRTDPTSETKSFKEIIEEDEIKLSGGVNTNSTASAQSKVAASQDGQNIDLSA